MKRSFIKLNQPDKGCLGGLNPTTNDFTEEGESIRVRDNVAPRGRSKRRRLEDVPVYWQCRWGRPQAKEHKQLLEARKDKPIDSPGHCPRDPQIPWSHKPPTSLAHPTFTTIFQRECRGLALGFWHVWPLDYKIIALYLLNQGACSSFSQQQKETDTHWNLTIRAYVVESDYPCLRRDTHSCSSVSEQLVYNVLAQMHKDASTTAFSKNKGVEPALLPIKTMKLYPFNVILCKCTKEGRELFMPGPETITKLLKEALGMSAAGSVTRSGEGR